MARAYGYGSRSYSFKGYDKDAVERIRQEARISGLPTRAVTPSADKVEQYTDVIGLDENGIPQYASEIRDLYYDPKKPNTTIDIDGNQVVNYKVDFDTVQADGATPAPLTVIPTTSTNASRPYTVAAGWARYPRQSVAYENSLGTLTLLFRDGTLWNYYDVSHSVWIRFSGSISKGQFVNINSDNPELNDYSNGPADISGVDQRTLNLIHTTARRIQLTSTSKRSYTYTNGKGEEVKAAPGKVVTRRAQKSLGKPPKTRNSAKKS